MYSPKIDEELIRVLYKIAKVKGEPMTEIVNEIVRKATTKDTLQKSKNNKGNN